MTVEKISVYQDPMTYDSSSMLLHHLLIRHGFRSPTIFHVQIFCHLQEPVLKLYSDG